MIVMLNNIILSLILLILATAQELHHFICCMADILTLDLLTILEAKAATGLLRVFLLTTHTNYTLAYLIFILLTVVLVIMVAPSVVLLDNHTTTRIGRR